MVAEYQPATGKYYYYTTDQINSTRVVTDDNGNLVYVAVHDPYRGIDHTRANSFNPELKFSGREQDTDSGLYYFGARYYDPMIYRFLSPDPVIPTDMAIYNPQRWNLYGYCLGNPVNAIDKKGQDPVNIQIVRIWEFAQENTIVGFIYINGQWSGYVMEHNVVGKLPEGTYEATVYNFGLKIDYMISGGFIAIHRGWDRRHSRGCFLVGWGFDFDNLKLINSTEAFTNLMRSVISEQSALGAALAYAGTSIEDVFWAWLMLDAISSIAAKAYVSVTRAYVGDVPRGPIPVDPTAYIPSYFA